VVPTRPIEVPTITVDGPALELGVVAALAVPLEQVNCFLVGARSA
jgi:hypothetical protein